MPIIEAHEARIAIDGTLAIEKLDLLSEGDRVLLAGDTTALFAAITAVPVAADRRVFGDDASPGEAQLVAGTLLVAGHDVGNGDHLRVVGVAPLDPPMPKKWTIEEYVAWSARLAGVSPRAARDLADAALARVGLTPSRRKPLGSSSLPERRVAVIAQGIVTSPPVLVAEAPLSGLDGPEAAFVAQAVASATAGRGALLSASRIDPGAAEGALARGATYVVVLAGGEIVLEGPPSRLFTGATHYALTVRANGAALRAELAARGIDLRGGPLRYSAALPAGFSTRDLLIAARAAHASVIELVPIAG